MLLALLLLLSPRDAAAQDLFYYLSPASLRAEWVIPPYPKHLSPENRSEIDRILALQATRSVQDCDRAFAESQISLKNFFTAPAGPLTADEARRLGALFERIRSDTDFFVKKAQKYFERPSPYSENPRIVPCVALEGTDSYPSGHATVARVFASILSERDPDRAAVYAARADQIAQDRVLAGVDRASDIEAGKKLAEAITAILQGDARFRKELLLYLRDGD